jgi:O-antigen ligase
MQNGVENNPLRREHALTGPVRRPRAPAAAKAERLFDVRAPASRVLVIAAGVAAVLTSTAAAGPVAGALALVACVSLAIGYTAPGLVAPFVVLFLPGGLRFDVLGVQVGPLEAAFGGCALGYAIRLALRREKMRLRVVDWAFVAFVVAAAISVFGPVDDTDRIRDVLFWAGLALVFHAASAHFRGRRDIRLLLVAIAAVTLAEASYAIFEYASRAADTFSLLGGAIVYPQAYGTMIHPNALGAFLVVGGLLTLALALAERGWPRWFGFVAVGACLTATAATYSRGAWISFVLALGAFLLDPRARRWVAIGGALLVAIGVALAVFDVGPVGARLSTFVSSDPLGLYGFRLSLARDAVSVIGHHPLTGVGVFHEFGTYAGRPNEATHPHNLFLGLAVFFGIPAALAFAAIFLSAVRSAWHGVRLFARPELRTMSAGILAALIAVFVDGAFDYLFWNVSLTVLVVLVLAVAFGAGAAAERISAQATAPIGSEMGVAGTWIERVVGPPGRLSIQRLPPS